MEELIRRIREIHDTRKSQGRIRFYMSQYEIENLKKDGFTENDIYTAVRSIYSNMVYEFDEKQNLIGVRGSIVYNKE